MFNIEYDKAQTNRVPWGFLSGQCIAWERSLLMKHDNNYRRKRGSYDLT